MITIEGNNIMIIEMSPEKELIEVIDGKTLFKGKVFEFSCDNEFEYGYLVSRNQKVTLYDYTAEPLEKGYVEKKTIKKAIKKIYKDNDDMLYMDIDENVDVIYDMLKDGGCFR